MFPFYAELPFNLRRVKAANGTKSFFQAPLRIFSLVSDVKDK
jgi:hypothetical protein